MPQTQSLVLHYPYVSFSLFLLCAAPTINTTMQALISAVFSIVFQAISQGFFPRFHVQHTSDHVRRFPIHCLHAASPFCP